MIRSNEAADAGMPPVLRKFFCCKPAAADGYVAMAASGAAGKQMELTVARKNGK